MTRDEIDIMWQKAMQESIKEGEIFTRYHFAEMVAQKSLAEHAMSEVQRLGQEIEQEPVAWPCLIDSADFSANTITLVMQCKDYKVTAGPHYLSTTPPQRTEQTSAERTLQHLGYTNHGGEYWKPPLGNLPQRTEIELVGMVKELFKDSAWNRLNVRGSTKVYLDKDEAAHGIKENT